VVKTGSIAGFFMQVGDCKHEKGVWTALSTWFFCNNMQSDSSDGTYQHGVGQATTSVPLHLMKQHGKFIIKNVANMEISDQYV
jgi:hypothetical protein